MALIVTTRHMLTVPGFNRRGGLCRDGVRLWAQRHNLDWNAFVRDGIDAELLLATGDGFAIAVVEWARKCEAGQAQEGCGG